MSTKLPTKKQAALLQFIEEYTEKHQLSPSYREIMEAMHLRSVSAVAEHINNCVKAGFLEKSPNQARTLKVIPINRHEETVEFFNQKIAELDQQMAAYEAEADNLIDHQGFIDLSEDDYASSEGAEAHLGESEEQRRVRQLKRHARSVEIQIECLRRAAEILEISL